MLAQEKQMAVPDSDKLSPNDKMLEAFERWATNGFMGLAHVRDPAELVYRLREWLSGACNCPPPTEGTVNEWLWQMGRRFPTFGSWLMEKLKSNILRGPLNPSALPSSASPSSAAPAADPPTPQLASISQLASSSYNNTASAHYPSQTFSAPSQPCGSLDNSYSSPAPTENWSTITGSAASPLPTNIGPSTIADRYPPYPNRLHSMIGTVPLSSPTSLGECHATGCLGFYSSTHFCLHKRQNSTHCLVPPEWATYGYDIEAAFEKTINLHRELEEIIATPSMTIGSILKEESKVIQALCLWEEAKAVGGKSKILRLKRRKL
ncbi:hypothetical protein SpCBS45565_g01702 [Spizellomyces sp. 'palustris']|nr:hypothetical protein SpCBS45565_g01702 [Spizellomyces sp. 'palustris']